MEIWCFEIFREADASDIIIEVLSRLRKTDQKKTRKPMPTQTIKNIFVMFSRANAGDFQWSISMLDYTTKFPNNSSPTEAFFCYF